MAFSPYNNAMLAQQMMQTTGNAGRPAPRKKTDRDRLNALIALAQAQQAGPQSMTATGLPSPRDQAMAQQAAAPPAQAFGQTPMGPGALQPPPDASAPPSQMASAIGGVKNFFNGPGADTGVRGFLGNHANTLSAMGAGLLAGDTPQEGFANAFGALPEASALDRQVRDDKSVKKALAGLENDPMMLGLPPAMRDLAKYDPAFAKGLYLQMQAGKGTRGWARLNDHQLYDPDTGETQDLGGDAGGGGAYYHGNSMAAQVGNHLIDGGQYSRDQVDQLMGGKTITGPNNEQIFMTPDGLLKSIQGGQEEQGQGATAITGPKMTEDMRKASGFASRAGAADTIIADPDVAGAGQSLTNRGLAAVPVIGNKMVPEDYQKFDQAQRDFINAMLRRESGAAISQSEFDNAQKQYFPQPGDGPEVLKQKAENRRLAIQSLNQSADPVPTFGKDNTASPTGGTTSTGLQWSLEP